MLTIKEAKKGVDEKEFSVSELVSHFRSRMEERKDINAIISSFDDSSSGKGELYGAVLVVKDNILVKGEKCTAASQMLESYEAPFSATVVNKLKEKGAVIIGKANMDEFAMGSSTETSFFGPTKNPLSPYLVPGGSSGGSAAAVMGGMCNAALGSDTGGSIRQPASFCGLVGMKPTYGAVSRNGLIAMSSSFDQIGPLTRNVEDAEMVFNAIYGKDEHDSTTVDFPLLKERGSRIGVPKEYFTDGMDKGVREVIDKAISKIESEVVEISLPNTEYALPAYYIIMASEVSSNMARFDGLRYGSCSRSRDILESYINSRGDYLGSEVKRRIILGTYSLSSGYYDAYYLQAQKVRNIISRDFEKAFQEVDFILTPTTPVLPFAIGERIDDPVSMYLADVFTVTANLAGLPAISLPCGERDGLSVGAQLIAPRFYERSLFREAEKLERLWKD